MTEPTLFPQITAAAIIRGKQSQEFIVNVTVRGEWSEFVLDVTPQQDFSAPVDNHGIAPTVDDLLGRMHVKLRANVHAVEKARIVSKHEVTLSQRILLPRAQTVIVASTGFNAPPICSIDTRTGSRLMTVTDAAPTDTSAAA